MTRDEELAEIREMMKGYKSMPRYVEIRRRNWCLLPVIERERNCAKTDLYHILEMKMKTFDMKDRYRRNND